MLQAYTQTLNHDCERQTLTTQRFKCLCILRTQAISVQHIQLNGPNVISMTSI